MSSASSTFVRGQIWYWDDPLFGRKENNQVVQNGESTIRYNRYCLIVQTTNTITSTSVLVIPCSSVNNTPHDVKIPMIHSGIHENFTYAKCRALFPVNPGCLKNYVCTLSDEMMEIIDNEIATLLFPKAIYQQLSLSDVTSDSNDLLSDSNEDNIKDNDIKISLSELDDYLGKQRPAVYSRPRTKSTKWSHEDIKNFMKFYGKNGLEVTSEKYKLKPATVKNYISKWEKQGNDETENSDDSVYVPNTKGAEFAVSSFSNLLNTKIREDGMFDRLNSTIKAKYGKELIESNEFYKTFNNTIYFSFIDFLGINVFGTGSEKECHVPSINKNSTRIKTWHFFDKICHDERINCKTTFEEVMETYFSLYSDFNPDGINLSWIKSLRIKIKKRYFITHEDSDFICDYIKSLCCQGK